MILNLFKSKKKWQHKDSNVRITAINEELDCNNSENKKILLSLLNTDSNELVRRAVLLKFNNFDDYYNASLINDNKAVQEFSYNQVQGILSESHDIKLTVEQKGSFLNALLTKPNIDYSLLNQWLVVEVEPQIIVKLFHALVDRKNTSSLLQQLFVQKKSSEVQIKLLSLDLKELHDAALLTKLLKKAVNEDVVEIIESKLAALVELEEKPKRIHKKCQLLLSKLLALKDVSDFGQYITKKSALEQEWKECIPELPILSDEEQQTLAAKYEKITAQLTNIFAPKEEAHQQDKIAAKLLEEKELAKSSFMKEISELSQTITTAVFENETFNDANIQNQLKLLSQKLIASVLCEQEQENYLKQISKLEERLTQLPEIAQSVSQATALISQVSQLTLPQALSELNERQKVYRDWQKQWQETERKACGILPQSINDSHKEITQLWHKGLKPLQNEQKQLFAQNKKKLIDLKRLLLSGKYKVCFGLFKGVTQTISLLSDNQQKQLQRDFEHVSKKIEEISDWEHYIATPRKQQILSEITQLVTTPLNNPSEQADKVKQYRKTWNSLGHADESVDQELNIQFNLACEEAFAPCRVFYAEQEKQREKHLVTRKEIIAQAIQLAGSIINKDDNPSEIDYKTLDGQLNKLQQQWQQAGEVDRQLYQKLYRQFKGTLQPIRKSIREYHDANGTSKQELIITAEQQLAVEDVYQAIDAVKELQAQWRSIGFSGTHQESKLWQNFRSINDQVFAKRDQLKSSQQSEIALTAKQFEQTLASIKTELCEDRLLQIKDQAEQLLNEVISHKPVIKSVLVETELFIKDLKNKISAKNAIAEQASWNSLFSLLNIIAQANSDIALEALVEAYSDEYQNLSMFWQKRLHDQLTINTQPDMKEREVKTLEIEILAQVESPKEFASDRLAVQVSLMQEQMLSGAEIDLSKSLVNWLRIGKLTSSDTKLLERLSQIYT